MTSVELPEGLTSIGDEAFAYSGLTFIKIPATITDWGGAPFGENLTSVELTEGLTSIGSYAFAGTGLKFATIPSTVSVIGDHALNTSSLLSVTLLGTTPPKIMARSINSLAVITVHGGSESAYRNAEYWRELRITDGKEPIVVVENIVNTVIWHSQTLDIVTASNRDVEVIIPANADWITYTPTRSMVAKTYTLSIAENPKNERRTAYITFKDKQSNESQIVSVEQSEKVVDNVIVLTEESDLGRELDLRPDDIADLTIIGVGINANDFYILRWNTYLTRLDISKTATTFIPNSAFQYTIKELLLPENLTDIGDSCSSLIDLESITLPKELIKIERKVLMYSKLISIVLPAKLKSIGVDSFSGNPIKYVTSLNPNPPVFEQGVFGNCPIEVVYVPSASIGAYKSAEGWSQFANMIKGI